MASSINWTDGPSGGTPLSAANLNKLAVVADVGTAGTPTGDALRAAYVQRTRQSINVLDYGTNAAAFNAAASAAGAGGSIYAPCTSPSGGLNTYTVDAPITLNGVSLISDGARLTVPTSLGTGVAAITVTGSGSYQTELVDFALSGPGTNSLGVQTTDCDGIRITSSAAPKLRGVFVSGFRRGIDFNNSVGHIYLDHVNVTNSYYGIYCSLNSYDYVLKDCTINGNNFANLATPADQGFEGLVIRDSHLGFAPYGIYQEATPAAQGIAKAFLQDCIFSHCRFESIGNAAILSDATNDSNNHSNTSDLNIEHPGFSWNSGYRIPGRPRDYALDLAFTQRLIRIDSGTHPFVAGDVNIFHIRQAAHAAFEVRGSTAAAGQLVADTGALNFFPITAPLAAGSPLALTGATAPTRYVGGTTSGAPTSGTFAKGDFIIDESGILWICTTAGTPGTWVNPSAAVASSFSPVTYVTGAYYSAPAAHGTATRPNGNITFLPLYVEQAHTFTGMAMEVTTAGNTGALVRLGVFSASGGAPGTLVFDAGTVAADTTGVKTLTGLSIPLTAGWYWLAGNVQSAATTAPTMRVVAPGNLVHGAPGFNVNSGAGYINSTGNQAALPSTAGTVTTTDTAIVVSLIA